MKTLVEGFTKQLQEALVIANSAVLTKKNNIQNIVVTGLGGSGIGGTILSELIQNECPIPVIINKDYFLPKFVDSNSLVIISSYSGNTEETLSAMKQAIDKNAQIVCVTSGGEVHAIADKYNFDTIIIPGGHPPRSCIGYSLIQLFKIIQFNGFVKTDLLGFVQSKDSKGHQNMEGFELVKYGKEFEIDLECSSREGFYDDKRLYAVYEKTDLLKLINKSF